MFLRILGGALALLGTTSMAAAATFTVTRFDDPAPGSCTVGDCSLREAAIAANANNEADTIILGAGTYNLTVIPGANDPETGDIDLTADEVVTIRGVSMLETTVRAQNGDRVFQARAAHFEDLGITGGAASTGAGVYGSDVLDLDFSRMRIFDNAASGFGGGLSLTTSSASTVSATFTAVEIFGNTANNGSAVYCTNANLACRFRFTEIHANTANFQAAVNVQGTSSVSFEYSSINNNQSDSHPGGLLSLNTDVSLTNTTISGNNADASVGGDGGGAGTISSGNFYARHLTVSGNTGAGGTDGLVFDNGATANFRASIIDDNCRFASGATTATAIATIETGNTCGLSGGEAVAVDVSPQDLALAGLEDNGGWGRSHALGDGSLARGRVPEANCTFPLRDQRSAIRYPASCDAGAYQTVPCSKPNVAIPDNTPAGIVDELVIDTDYRMDRLQFFVAIEHTWVGDLNVTLEHVESGLSARIVERPGLGTVGDFGCSDNDMVIDFDDGAAAADAACLTSGQPEGQAFAVETYSTTDPLSVFDGLSTEGTWRLTVSDNAADDTGTLQQWCFFDPGQLADIFADRFE